MFCTPCMVCCHSYQLEVDLSSIDVPVRQSMCVVLLMFVCAVRVAESKGLQVGLDSIGASSSHLSPLRPALQPLNNKGIVSCSFFYFFCGILKQKNLEIIYAIHLSIFKALLLLNFSLLNSNRFMIYCKRIGPKCFINYSFTFSSYKKAPVH